MAGCILFASGRDFDVDSFLELSPWHELSSVIHIGDKSKLKSRPPAKTSGLQIKISDDKANTPAQIEKAITFLEKNSSEMQRLKDYPGVENVELRFGGWWYENTAAFALSIPPKLVALAGQNGVEISICVYASAGE